MELWQTSAGANLFSPKRARRVLPKDHYLIAADRQAEAHEHEVKIGPPHPAEQGVQAVPPRPGGMEFRFHGPLVTLIPKEVLIDKTWAGIA